MVQTWEVPVGGSQHLIDVHEYITLKAYLGITKFDELLANIRVEKQFEMVLVCRAHSLCSLLNRFLSKLLCRLKTEANFMHTREESSKSLDERISQY